MSSTKKRYVTLQNLSFLNFGKNEVWFFSPGNLKVAGHDNSVQNSAFWSLIKGSFKAWLLHQAASSWDQGQVYLLTSIVLWQVGFSKCQKTFDTWTNKWLHLYIFSETSALPLTSYTYKLSVISRFLLFSEQSRYLSFHPFHILFFMGIMSPHPLSTGKAPYKGLPASHLSRASLVVQATLLALLQSHVAFAITLNRMMLSPSWFDSVVKIGPWTEGLRVWSWSKACTSVAGWIPCVGGN